MLNLAADRITETPKIHPLNKRGIATILHSLDIFAALVEEGVGIPESCTHFAGTTPPTAAEIDILQKSIQTLGLATVGDLEKFAADYIGDEQAADRPIIKDEKTAGATS